MPVPQAKQLLENDLRDPDIYDLKAILHALSDFKPNDDDVQREIARLNGVFDSASKKGEPIPDTWKDEALGYLTGLKKIIDTDLAQGEATGKKDDLHYKEAEAFYLTYQKNRAVGRVVADGMREAATAKDTAVASDSGKEALPGFPSNCVHNSINDTIYGILRDPDTASLDPHALAPALYAIYEQFGHRAPRAQAETVALMHELKTQYFDDGRIGYDWAAKAVSAIDKVGGPAMQTFTYKLLPGGDDDRQFVSSMDEAKKLAAQKPVTVGLPGEAEKQEEAVEQIKNIQLKMKQEHSGIHINSSKYRNMRTAVDEVCKLADTPGGYDPVKMAAALKKVNEASSAYVESKVLDKTKKTGMGIARKNTALLLMQVTDPESVNEIVDRVEDFRLDKHNDQTVEGDGPDRKKTSLKKLMDAEIGRNSARAKGKLGKGLPENSNQAAIDAGVKRYKASRTAKTAQQDTKGMGTPGKSGGN